MKTAQANARPPRWAESTTTSLSLAASAYPAHSCQHEHAHNELQLTILLTGSVRERVGSQIQHAGPLSVVVKDPGVRHADQFGGAGALTARLSAPSTTFSDLVEHPARALDWRWLHGGGAAMPFLRLVSRRIAGEIRFPVDDDDLSDLLAVLSARHCSPDRGQPPVWVRQAVLQIRDGWHAGLTVRDVAGAARVHPVYLARCLRRWYGVSGADMLRQSRFRHAAMAVANGDRSVASVAQATGFADEAHFCRAFSALVGLPPGRFRRLARTFAKVASTAAA
jgi:AraC family transcriptional regulator